MKTKIQFLSIAVLLASQSFVGAQPVPSDDVPHQPASTNSGSSWAPNTPAPNTPLSSRGASSPGAGASDSVAIPGQPDSALSSPGRTPGRTLNALNPENRPQTGRAGRTRSTASSQHASNSALDETTDQLAFGLIDEEGGLDLNSAMASYQSVIRRFDSQRQGAATAVFRLGECYRKLGQLEEAKVCYGRILREFPDQTELVRQSQRYLFDAQPGRTSSTPASSFQQRLQTIVSRAGQTGANALEPYSDAMPQGGTAPTYRGEATGLPPTTGYPAPSDPFGSGVGGSTAGGYGGGGGYAGAGLGGGLGAGGLSSGFGGMAGNTLSSTRATVPSGVQSQVYGSFGRASSAPAATELEKELRFAKGRVTALLGQLSTIRHKMQVIENVRPETLPESIAPDTRYRQLREEYERAILNETKDDPQSQKAVETARVKLNTWIQKIFLPDQKTAIQLATYDLERAEERVAELEVKVKAEADQRKAELKRLTPIETTATQGALELPKTTEEGFRVKPPQPSRP